MRFRPVIIVIILCVLGIAATSIIYGLGRQHVQGVFAGELSVDSLTRLIDSKKTCVVYFYSRSCEDCAVSEPYLVEALTEAQAEGWWPAEVPVYKCEREANATVRSLYGIEQTPALVLFKGGQEGSRQEGPLPDTESYTSALANLVGKQGS